jgi:hypothetical protein
VHLRAGPGPGDLLAPEHAGLLPGGVGQVVEDGPDLAGAGAGGDVQRRDDQVADAMVQLAGQLGQRLVQVLPRQPVGEAHDRRADQHRGGRRGRRDDPLDAAGRAHAVPEHLRPGGQRLGAVDLRRGLRPSAAPGEDVGADARPQRRHRPAGEGQRHQPCAGGERRPGDDHLRLAAPGLGPLGLDRRAAGTAGDQRDARGDEEARQGREHGHQRASSAGS